MGLTFNPEIEVVCSFCKGKVLLGKSEGIPCIAHSDPYCKEFLDRDILDFLKENRARLGIPDCEEN